MDNLSVQYRPLFNIYLEILKNKHLAALISWFVTVRKIRDIFEYSNLIQDKFSEKGAVRKSIDL